MILDTRCFSPALRHRHPTRHSACVLYPKTGQPHLTPLFRPIIPPYGILCDSSPAVHPSRGRRTHIPLATTRQIRHSIRGPEGHQVFSESRPQPPEPTVSHRSPSGSVCPRTGWPSSRRELTPGPPPRRRDTCPPQSPPHLDGGRACASIARPGRPLPPRPALPTYGGREALPALLSCNIHSIRESSTAAIPRHHRPPPGPVEGDSRREGRQTPPRVPIASRRPLSAPVSERSRAANTSQGGHPERGTGASER